MRHKNSGKKLNRTPSHRKALFRNMAKALLTYGKIRTTETKAMALRGVVEPLITLALRNDLHSRREAYKVLGNHQLVKKLFDDIGPAFSGISGGYTRVTKLGMPRPGDCAPLAMIELVYTKEVPASAKAEKKSTPAVAEAATPAEAIEEAAPDVETSPDAETAPVEETASAEEVVPVEETAPVEEAASGEESVSVEEAAPDAEAVEAEKK
jgi:large subunit ribosomal protein L17